MGPEEIELLAQTMSIFLLSFILSFFRLFFLSSSQLFFQVLPDDMLWKFVFAGRRSSHIAHNKFSSASYNECLLASFLSAAPQISCKNHSNLCRGCCGTYALRNTYVQGSILKVSWRYTKHKLFFFS